MTYFFYILISPYSIVQSTILSRVLFMNMRTIFPSMHTFAVNFFNSSAKGSICALTQFSKSRYFFQNYVIFQNHVIFKITLFFFFQNSVLLKITLFFKTSVFLKNSPFKVRQEFLTKIPCFS